MAFTENQLRNITGIEDEWMTIPLIPSGVVTEDEIENWTNLYIGVDYAPGPPIADFAFAIVAPPPPSLTHRILSRNRCSKALAR